MKRTKTKFLSVFLSFCMIVSCMVGISLTASATSTTTVVWDSTEFVVANTEITLHEGISLTGGYVQYQASPIPEENGERKLYTGNNTNTSFSTTLGVFTEITVTGGWHYNGKAFFTGDGWSNATWSGDPASTVPFNLYTMMTDAHGSQPWSITFTIAPAPTHTHSFTYSASGATITATCTAGCPDSYDTTPATLTIAAAGGTYDGTTAYSATVTNNIPAVTGDTVGDVAYYKVDTQGATTGGTVQTGAPTGAGYYYASVTLTSGSNTYTAVKAFTVAKADPTAPTGLTATYGQTLADVSLPTGWTWADDTTTSVGEVGDNTFKANYTPTGTDATNYNSKTDVELTVTVSSSVTYTLVPTSPATCTEDGNEEYYTKDGKYYTKSGDDYTETTLEAVTIPALGHDYVEHIITAATCTEDGESEFICSRCKDSYKKTVYALGHSWGKAEYVWSDDLSTCTGTAVCKRDKSHTTTETVTVTTEVTKEAKCTTKGSMTYTATFTTRPFRTQTKTVELPALGHDRDENGVCKRCGDTPSRGPSGGDSTTPTTPTTTTPVTSETKEPEATITGDVVDGTTNELSWSVGGNVKEFDLYVEKDGKFLFLQTVTDSHANVICGINGKYYIEDGGKYNEYTYQDGKFVKTGTISADKIDSVKKKNNVTNEFMVKCKSDGKNVELKVSVKTYYKPAVKVTAKKNGAYLKWEKVDGATKYRLSKLVNGKLKKVADVNGTAINLTGLKSGKTYTYAVKALVNNKWTTVWKSDLVTVTAK